jgi:hypothetical protein
VLLYGNFRFIEYPAVREPVLDYSLLRYWLPLAVLESLGICALVISTKRFIVAKSITAVLGGGILVFSLALIGFDNTIGLRWTLPRISHWQEQSRWLINNKPPGSLVIAGSIDKLIFPRRHVIGYDGIIQPGTGDVGNLSSKTRVYAITSNIMQRGLLEQRYPAYTVDEPLVGPEGVVLFPLLRP